MLVEAFGDLALFKTQCFEHFKRFKEDDFQFERKEAGKPPQKFEDSEFQVLLYKNDSRTQEEHVAWLGVSHQRFQTAKNQWGKSRSCQNGCTTNWPTDSSRPAKQFVRSTWQDSNAIRYCIESSLEMKNLL